MCGAKRGICLSQARLRTKRRNPDSCKNSGLFSEKLVKLEERQTNLDNHGLLLFFKSEVT